MEKQELPLVLKRKSESLEDESEDKVEKLPLISPYRLPKHSSSFTSLSHFLVLPSRGTGLTRF